MKYNKNKIVLLCHLCILSLPAAASDFYGTVQAFYANKDYSTAGKEPLNIAGIYASLGYEKHSIEGEFDQSFTKDNYIQEDWIVTYNNFQIKNIQLHVGYHNTNYIESDADYQTPFVGIYYTHLNQYGYAQLKLGLDGYYVQNVSLDSLNFMQVSPYYGHYFALPNSSHYFYTQLTLNAQFFDEPTFKDTTFLSPEVMVDYVANSLTLSLIARAGNSVNQYKAGGFIFNNDDLTYKEGVTFTAKYDFNSTVHIKGLARYQTYDFYNPAIFSEDSGNMIVLAALIGINF